MRITGLERKPKVFAQVKVIFHFVLLSSASSKYRNEEVSANMEIISDFDFGKFYGALRAEVREKGFNEVEKEKKLELSLFTSLDSIIQFKLLIIND